LSDPEEIKRRAGLGFVEREPGETEEEFGTRVEWTRLLFGSAFYERLRSGGSPGADRPRRCRPRRA